MSWIRDARCRKEAPRRCAWIPRSWRLTWVREPVRRRSMLAIDNLTSRYGRIEVLHGVSCEVEQGEIVTLVGSNGAGKSTLLRAVSGVQPVASGTIRLDGQTINTLSAHAR